MTYNNCVNDIMNKLSSLPPRWAEKIACNICKLLDVQETCAPLEVDCEYLNVCQSITELSEFTLSDNKVCISYKDERMVRVTRCFDFSYLTDEINNTDGTCITPLWGQLSPKEKWQSVIDQICYCCDPTTTTTTTSTTTTSSTTTTTTDTPTTTTTTTSTTTTTTIPPCRCYSITNPGGPSRYVTYYECQGTPTGVAVDSGQTVYLCAIDGTISGFGVTVVMVAGDCLSGCGAEVTTTTTTSTTTTSSTTTTTTIAPVTTTTTSTTTTTTAAPIQDNYVYFSNSGTSGNRGAKIWFSQQDYYSPNTPADLVAANCLSISDLGTAPVITVELNYWEDDVTASIDDGFGAIRTPDGTKVITISTDLLTYNGSSGAWQRGSSIFTLGEGLNIAAFEITSVTTPYTTLGVQHDIHLPPYHHFIRVHNTFDEGSTGVIWFDL